MAVGVDHAVRLRDGRLTAYAQYGSPDGYPVINAHGGLACRLDVAAADSVATDLGVRLISPDRPGVGLSCPQPGRTVLDWARDVAELLDSLDVDRFSVMGWSMGGQYAAAVGHALVDRVNRVAIVAGVLPLTEPGVFQQLPSMDRHLTRISQRSPWLARQCFRAMGALAGAAPTLYGRLAARALGPADAAVIRDEGFTAFSQMSHEAFRQPHGAAEEYRAWMRPWGFALEDLKVHVDVWMGLQDELVDKTWPEQLAARIPHAALHVRAGGHFVAHRHYREILDALRRPRSNGVAAS